MRFSLFSRRGQATTETVLLFPVFVIFILFIIKIFGLLVLSQKMEIAAFYAGRRYQLQSHVARAYQRWNKRFLEKDIQKKLRDYLGFNNAGMVRFLGLKDLKMRVSHGTWTQVTLTVYTRPPRIKFLCNYDKLELCDNEVTCLRGYAFLCETGGQLQKVVYVGPNERPLPFVLPE